jgi:hypothetical protein
MPVLSTTLQTCSSDIRNVLERIAEVLERDVVIEDVKGPWVGFRVIGLTDWCAATEIEQNKQEIFGDDWLCYPIRTWWAMPDGAKVWIYDGEDFQQYLPGHWHY